MQTVTQWFPAGINPVRAGLYQRNWGDQIMTDHLDYFDGHQWHIMDMIYSKKLSVSTSSLGWRGLARKPK